MRNHLLVSACTLALVTASAALAADKTPQYGQWGFDMAGADANIQPGNDFFRFANGHWLDQAVIPADKPAWTLRLAMTDATNTHLRAILESAAANVDTVPTTLEGKIGAFYASYMDTARIDALGVKAIAPQLDAVRAANTREQLAALMGRSSHDFDGSLFSLAIYADLKDPKHYALYVGQAGLGLPDRDYYLKPDFAAQKAAYQAYVKQLLGLCNWPDADNAALDVVAFETRIAQASWDKTQQRDVNATYNAMSVEQLQALTPGFAWNAFLQQADPGEREQIVVAEKSAFPKLVAIFSDTPVVTLQAWQAWQAARIVDHAASHLPQPFQQASFELHDKILSGQQVETARWKRGVRAVAGGDALAGDRRDSFGNMSWGVGDIYSAKYFPPQSKAQIEDLVDNLKAAYHARIEQLDWMGAETKKEALRKLDTYTIKVGYPEHPRDYSNLVVRNDDLIGNVTRAASDEWNFYVARIDGPVDHSEWYMSPQTNDAYNGPLRDIVFPAGILQPPIFDANADPAINYGAAGGVIGHELTHGFDDQGRKIDADGALRDWWTAADAAAFDARAKQLAAQYSAFEPLTGVHVNGELTLGENIADLGGLTLALDAYHHSLHGKPAPVLDGYTGDQRVFLGWAQAWRGKLREDATRRQVVSDPHSPRNYRVNGVVRNMDAWYADFGVKPNENLYVAPKDRVRIW